MVDVIQVIWTIFIGISSFVAYKVIPELKTRIFVHKNINEDLFFALVTYEMFGTLFFDILAIVWAVLIGDSTLEHLILIEYLLACIVMILIYWLGVFIIIWYKKKEIRKKYLKNFIWSGIIYLTISLSIMGSEVNANEDAVTVMFMLLAIVMLLGQYASTLENIKTKNVTYIVYTKDENFKSGSSPVKNGDFYYINVTDEEGKRIKQIQVPKDKILKIECPIEEVETTELEEK